MDKVSWKPGTVLAPLPVVLIGSGEGTPLEPYNVMTAAWCGIVNSEPPMLSVSIRPERYSYRTIVERGEFTVNVPTAKIVSAVDSCGVVSGKTIDKFSRFGLTALPGEKISAPAVKECPINLECKTSQIIKLGSHDLFIAEIVALRVSREYIDAGGKFDFSEAGILGYANGAYYVLGEKLGTFGFSVNK